MLVIVENSQTASLSESTTLAVGPRVLESRYVLSPLAGYTHLAFRTVLRERGGLGLATTDLVLPAMLLGGGKKSLDLVETTPADRPLSVQLSSGNVDDLMAAARWLEDRGYGGVDLNMGCPMGKITGGGGGAKLLCRRDDTCRLVEQVVQAVRIPVTVKMRLGWDRTSITSPDLARAFEERGVAAITIHGRTRSQGFHGTVDLQGIRETVAAVRSIPVFGNGDVRTVDEALHMRRVTGCAGVAIGRGAMLDPWIFRKLRELSAGQTPTDPTADEMIEFLIRHFTLMTAQHDDFSCRMFRKFAAWYGARLGIPEDLEDRLRRFESFAEFDEIVEQIRRRHGERESTIPTALVRVPNGPVEKW